MKAKYKVIYIKYNGEKSFAICTRTRKSAWKFALKGLFKNKVIFVYVKKKKQ